MNNVIENRKEYYIWIGRRGKLYTLWAYNSFRGNEYFIKSLSANKDEAVRKATEYFENVKKANLERFEKGLLFFNPEIFCETKDWNDFNCVPFGKYEGMELEEFNDNNYKTWLFFEMLENKDNEHIKFFNALKDHVLNNKIIVEYDGEYLKYNFYEKIMNGEYVKYDGKYIHHKKYESILLDEKLKEESEYFGDVGDKFEGKVTLLKNFSFETAFGTLYIVTFLTEDNNVILYKGSKDFFDFNFDDIEFYIKGTIKDHTEYNGVKQTQLKNVKDFSPIHFIETCEVNVSEYNNFDEWIEKEFENTDEYKDGYDYFQKESKFPKKEFKYIKEQGIIKEMFENFINNNYEKLKVN